MKRPTRRQAVGGLATLIAGGGAVALTPQEAGATAAVDDISIDDATYESESGNLHTPWLDLDVSYEYSTNDTPSTVRLLLMVGPPTNQDLLQMAEEGVASTTGQGEVDLAGKVIEAEAFDSSQFDVSEPGDSVTVTIPFGVVVQVRDADGNTLVDGDVQTSVDVTVRHTGTTVEVSLSVTGDVVMQGNESDPKPV